MTRDNVCWELPIGQCLKINVDAALSKCYIEFVVGIIDMSKFGTVVSAQATQIGSCSPLFAELWAVRYRIEWAWNNVAAPLSKLIQILLVKLRMSR